MRIGRVLTRDAGAGVDIDVKMGALRRAKKDIRKTFTQGVVGDIGSFGGLFKSPGKDMLLVSSADGVGTKLKVAVMARQNAAELRADDDVYAHPETYYDQVLEIDLSAIEPHLNGPFTPDAATPVSQMKGKAQANDYPMTIEVGHVGS